MSGITPVKSGASKDNKKECLQYIVKDGETLSGIAKKYGTRVSAIMKLNPLITDVDKIRAGIELNIPVATFPREEQRVPKPEERPLADVERNNITEKSKNEKISFVYPVNLGISSKFGMRMHPVLKTMKMHNGVDFHADEGTSVRSSAEGTIKFAGKMTGYGNIVIIDHGNGFETRYAHLKEFLVKTGDKVLSGQQIGLSGKTGRVTGAHLHFEIRKDSVPINPSNVISK